MEYLRPSDLAPQNAKDHLDSAVEFLRIGKEEIQAGRRGFRLETLREGAEKVFHALVEATSARLLKYGVMPPAQHRETLSILQGMDPDLHQAYEDAFARLHVLTYYQGVIDIERIETSVNRVEETVSRIRKYIRGR